MNSKSRNTEPITYPDVTNLDLIPNKPPPPYHVLDENDIKKNLHQGIFDIETKITSLEYENAIFPKLKKDNDYPDSTNKKRKLSLSSDDTKYQDNHIHKPEIELSDEQESILNSVVYDKESLFISGSAGVGKSFLLREIIKKLKEIYKLGEVAITASTGIAACNIGGCTLHWFAGVGLGRDSVYKLVRRIQKNPDAQDKWNRVKVLIIDEISMVNGEFFDKINEIAKGVRNNKHPFGGIQLVVTGDFLQLPPIGIKENNAKFAFETNAWSEAIGKPILLQKVWRQTDREFVDILNEVRLGKVSSKTSEILKSLSRKPNCFNKDIEPTQLFAVRKQVDTANSERLARLPGQLYEYQAKDDGEEAKIEQACVASKLLQLKIGAQVMLLKNTSNSLVNGSMGIVVGFAGERDYSHENNSNGQMSTKRTKHDRGTKPPNPIVRFMNGEQITVAPEVWTIELPNGEFIASRTQIPLNLAWAISIHKSQGQTIPLVKINLDRIFEYGHAYVALSRATSLNGLQVVNFNPEKVTAHPKVLKFYEDIINPYD